MAYIKYKELTKYFNFNKQISLDLLPKYVTDYVSKDETVYAAYKTFKDKGIFTDKKMILFDLTGIRGLTKKIHVIPYTSISSSAILFKKHSAAILFSFDSGYQMKLNFVKLNAEGKTNLRLLYCKIVGIEH